MPRMHNRLIAAILSVLALGSLASCASDDRGGAAATTSSTASEGPWTFTDDAGETVTLEERPERIAMFEDVAASMIDLGVQPAGIHFINGTEGNRLFEDVDLTGVETVGSNCDTLNIEALAAMEPDLVIYMLWDAETFCLTPDQVDQVEQVAPLVRIQAVGESNAIRDRYLELASALGADPESEEQVAKRDRFDAAVQRLHDAVGAHPGISVIPVSIGPEWAGVAEPSAYSDLVTLRDEFGIQLTGPFDAAAASTGTYWQELSAETIADFRGDVILMDAKNETPLQDKLDAYPLWARLPEVQAGQIVDWWVPGSFSYTRDADALEALAAAIEQAEDLVDE
jgi:iron complex transport system substrate-binding protein